jgi:hypothetical protein
MGSGADADGGNAQGLGHPLGRLGRDRFQQQRAGSGALHPPGVLEQSGHGRFGPGLDPVAAQGVEGLGSKSEMAHHGDAFGSEGLNQVEFGSFELDHGHPALLDEADACFDPLGQ